MKRADRYVRVLAAAIVLSFIGSVVAAALAEQAERVIRITAKKFEYSPNEIRLKKGVPVVLELTSLDRLHGFDCPELGIRSDIEPGKVTTVRFVPDKVGTFSFHCDIFCGDGHEDMAGRFVVEE